MTPYRIPNTVVVNVLMIVTLATSSNDYYDSLKERRV